jgi:arginyl-tRNA synthetase
VKITINRYVCAYRDLSAARLDLSLAVIRVLKDTLDLVYIPFLEVM